MKKLIALMIILFCLFTINVDAKTCTPITGNGREIGNEVDCAGERFYVIDNSNDELRLMAKYNLMTNGKCDIYMLDSPLPLYQQEHYNQLIEKVNQLMIEYYPNYDDNNRDYYWDTKYGNNRDVVGIKICYFGNYENTKTYKQDENAIAFKGNINNIQFPYEGLFHSVRGNDYPLKKNKYMTLNSIINSIFNGIGETADIDEYYNNIHYEDVYNKYFFDFELGKTSDEHKIYDSYKKYLEDNDIKVKRITSLSTPELIDLINKISDKTFNIDDYSNPNEWVEVFGNDSFYGISSRHYVVADLKEFIPEEYKWIYGTTYWLNTISIHYEAMGQMFVITMGELCIDESMCSHPSVGLRPIVSIEKYKIESRTDGHGSIEVINRAFGGDSITFKVMNNKGYILQSVTITTESGKRITFNREDIQDNKDGTYTIKNSFIMPEENIVIEGKFYSDLTNPNTKNIMNCILLLLTMILITALIINKKKLSE